MIDTSQVSIRCPSNIVVNCKSPQGTQVSFAPVAQTQCGTPVDALCDPPSGSLFPIGTTPVVCRVGGAAGQQISCSFRVVVRCLTVNHAGIGQVTIAWTGGVLETAPSVTGPWQVFDATSPVTLSVRNANGAPRGFFRLRFTEVP